MQDQSLTSTLPRISFLLMKLQTYLANLHSSSEGWSFSPNDSRASPKEQPEKRIRYSIWRGNSRMALLLTFNTTLCPYSSSRYTYSTVSCRLAANTEICGSSRIVCVTRRRSIAIALRVGVSEECCSLLVMRSSRAEGCTWRRREKWVGWRREAKQMVLEKRYRIILSSAQSSITTREPSQSNSPTRSGSPPPPALTNNRQFRSGLLSLTCELPSASYWYTNPSTSRPTQKSSMKIREKEASSANSGLFLQSSTKGLFLASTSRRMGRRTRHPPSALTAPVIKQLSRSSKSCVRRRKMQCCMFHCAKYSCREGPSKRSRLLHRPTSHSVAFPPSSHPPSRNLNCTSLFALATLTLPRHRSPAFHSSLTA